MPQRDTISLTEYAPPDLSESSLSDSLDAEDSPVELSFAPGF